MNNKEELNKTNKYQKGKIYKIISDQIDDIYIGSTTQNLSARIGQHRRNYKEYLLQKRNNCTSFQLIKYNDCKIILLELFPCNCKEELEARERFYIENNNCVNRYIPGRTRQEYRKKYLELNREMILIKKQEYRELHRDELSKKQREYRLINKDIIKEKSSTPFECKCGGRCQIGKKSIHFKTKMHQNWLNSQN